MDIRSDCVILELTENAKNILEQSIEDKDSKFLFIKMVKYDCHGPVLSMSLTSKIDDNVVIKSEGYNFLMSEEELTLFDRIKVDYETEGLSQGFKVTPIESSLNACFITDEEYDID